jgi:membrane-bound lytic murein transglycosylase D
MGCSHALHYNYPPPHQPGQVLDLSSTQDPETPAEQPLPDANEPQLQETAKETILATPQPDQPVPEGPFQDQPVQTEVTDRKDPGKDADHKVNPQVRYWMDRLSGRDRKTFQSQLARLDKIRPVMEQIFAQHGLPKELVYLCLVESGANPHAVSCSGATGYWQFIPDTAKKFGLQVNKYVDERKNLEKSTRAAALYLKHLYAIFGDWYLAIAAYNAGEGSVTRLMKNNGIKTFWDIDTSMAIKAETLEYVPKYIATVVLAGNPAAYGLPLYGPSSPVIPKTVDDPGYVNRISRAGGTIEGPLAQTTPEIMTDADPPSLSEIRRKIRGDAEGSSGIGGEDQAASFRYTVRKGDTLYTLARRYSTSVETIARENRLSAKQGLRAGKTIVIPAGSAQRGEPDDLQRNRIHTVAQGETLESISQRYGVTVRQMTLANNIKNPRRIQPSMSLVIPPSQGSNGKSSATKYTVKKGDTLWGISRQFDVSSMDLMKWNRLTTTAQIKPGDKLTIRSQ